MRWSECSQPYYVLFGANYTESRFVDLRLVVMAVRLGFPPSATMAISTEERAFFVAM
jgi:hypothetical protein